MLETSQSQKYARSHCFLSSSGLGLATSTLFLSHNANVSILDLNPPPPSSHPSIEDANRTHYIRTDVSSTDSLTSAIDSTVSWIKKTGCPLAGVICCAGIGTAERALPRQRDPNKPTPMSMSIFDKVVNINLRGTVGVIRLVLPHLSFNEAEGLDGERGIVIVVSSVAAYEGQVGQLAYSASKGAVASMVLPLAREVGRSAGIRVMGIAPGAFETAMTSGFRQKPEAHTRASISKGGDGAGVINKEGQEKADKTGAQAAVNQNMVEYPPRMGRGDEFARLVREIVENPMLNGGVVRLDGGVRMPSRL